MGNRSSKAAEASQKLDKAAKEPLPPYIADAEQTEEPPVEPDWKTIDEDCLTAKYLGALSDRRCRAMDAANEAYAAWLSKLIIRIISMKLAKSDMKKGMNGDIHVFDMLKQLGLAAEIIYNSPGGIQWNKHTVSCIAKLVKTELECHFKKMGFHCGWLSLSVKINPGLHFCSIRYKTDEDYSLRTKALLEKLDVGYFFCRR